MYSAFLVENDIDHMDTVFNQFVNQNFDGICPAVGAISYEDGIVKCRVHEDGSEDNVDEPPGDEVLWL